MRAQLMPPEVETVHALRSDVAHQIARYAERLGISQLAAAKRLHVPQPTLSKIVNGHTSDLSLELLLRIAVRAGLRITLQTGLVPQEAGAYVALGRPFSARTFPSKIAARTNASLMESLRELTPDAETRGVSRAQPAGKRAARDGTCRSRLGHASLGR